MADPDYKYDVDAQETEVGVTVDIAMVDNVDGITQTVHLGTFTDHEEAALAAGTWVRADVENFANIPAHRQG